MPENENIQEESPEEVNDISQQQTIEQNEKPQLQTTNHKLQTEMEVHHHPDLHHRKKKFKEYFLEFLMIFLAVTLGFFAENVRENITEQSKAKEFATSLIKDIEEDNSFLNSAIDTRLWREKKLDSLAQMLGKPLLPAQYNDIYYYSRFLFLPIPFPTSDATFQELKSSGSMRYFKSIKLQSQISNYYVLSSVLKNDNDLTMLEQEAYKITSQILTERYFSETIGNTMGRIENSVIRLNHPTTLLSTDPVLLNQLASLASVEKNNSVLFRVIASGTQLKNGTDLIASLKKEYNIK
jgi:hypothetical protein